MSKIVAYVPIKTNNLRVPGKNTRAFEGGKPLVTNILDTLLKVRYIDEVHVFTSDETINDYLPVGAIFQKRSTSLDTDLTKGNDIYTAFAEAVSADIYVLVHATAPFITSKSIEKGIDAVLNNGYDSALSVAKIQTFLWKDGRPFNYSLNERPRTQDIDPIYEETSGFFIYSNDVVQNDGRNIGDNPYPVEVSKIEAIDIDEPLDFDIANAVWKEIVSKGQEY